MMMMMNKYLRVSIFSEIKDRHRPSHHQAQTLLMTSIKSLIQTLQSLRYSLFY